MKRKRLRKIRAAFFSALSDSICQFSLNLVLHYNSILVQQMRRLNYWSRFVFVGNNFSGALTRLCHI